MVFSDGPNNIGGYDPRFILFASAVDYGFYFFDGMFFTLQVGDWIVNFLPEWLAFLPVLMLMFACFFLAILGPFVLVYLFAKGWKGISDE